MVSSEVWFTCQAALVCIGLLFSSLACPDDFKAGELIFSYRAGQWYVRINNRINSDSFLSHALGTDEEVAITVTRTSVSIPFGTPVFGGDLAGVHIQVTPHNQRFSMDERPAIDLRGDETGQYLERNAETSAIGDNSAVLNPFTFFNIWTAEVLHDIDDVACKLPTGVPRVLPGNLSINSGEVPIETSANNIQLISLVDNREGTLTLQQGSLSLPHFGTDSPYGILGFGTMLNGSIGPSATVTALTHTELSREREWAKVVHEGNGLYTYAWRRFKSCKIWNDLKDIGVDACGKFYQWAREGNPKQSTSVYTGVATLYLIAYFNKGMTLKEF